ncbi:hypothetical protein [Salinigranum sp. GCM10025319]|uniref:hypothetical protein n=1 Tax=Salinigranum sp. GCM10025319 TaxID=3252687 RepID=UPI00361527DA
MVTAKRRRFIHANVAWMLAAALVLALLDTLSYELFFVAALTGFLIVVELTAPFRITPTWRRRIKWIILLGLAGFGYVTVQRILAIISVGAS